LDRPAAEGAVRGGQHRDRGAVRGRRGSLQQATGRPMRKGPADVRALPEWYGREAVRAELEQRDARVFAVINDVQSPSREQVSERAEAYRTEGADVIDLGLSLDRPWLSDPKTIAALRERGLSLSIDALVELRRRRPDAEMLMGIGNLTELTEADSTGITALLIGFCQEVGIGAVLTTEVIGWAHGVVKKNLLTFPWVVSPG
jgi:hypothetical protein